MTEEEWLSAHDTTSMLKLLAGKVNDRKLRLLAVACCRAWPLPVGIAELRAIGVAEMYADGGATLAELDAVYRAACDEFCARIASPPDDQYVYAVMEIMPIDLGPGTAAERGEPEDELLLLRDIFGNPFRPVAFSPSWRTDTAVALARGMYESRDFGAMPILADALQDAGCAEPAILDHCRDPQQTHVRGCWVVDLVLGKE